MSGARASGRVSGTGAWFARRLIDWHHAAGRHDLPWQGTRDPYRIWVSEIMLQQTRVSTAIPYYLRFLERFPDLNRLAGATGDEVLALWSGLGYYSRARLLHRCAQQLVGEFGGAFPRDQHLLVQLPGIGPSTAAAIAVFAFGGRAAILDGNVKRVLCRFLGVRAELGTPEVTRQLWDAARSLLPDAQLEDYTQALMDLGTLVCTARRPSCARCPLELRCDAAAAGDADQLPKRARRAPLSVRRVTLLVLVQGERVLLEKRPPVGVWGGLWSLPESTSETPVTLAREIGERFVPALGALEALDALEAFDHVFTHFRLRVSPWLAQLGAQGGASLTAAEPERRWFSRSELDAVGLPAPVRSLLVRVSFRRAAAPPPGA